MSKHRIRGSGRMPEQWEWTCDYCGKNAHTNSQATRPPGWFPRGRTIGTAHDFCSPEHEAAFKAGEKHEVAEVEAVKADTTVASAEPAKEEPVS